MKEGPNIVDEEVGRCLGSLKVVASVVEIPGDNVFVVAFRKESDRLGDVGKVRETEWDGGGSSRHMLSVSILVIKARRGCRRVRQPVHHHVREDVVEAYCVSVYLVVPGKLAHWRIGQGMSQGLRHGGLQGVVSSLIFNPPLKGLPMVLLLLRKGFQLGRVTRGEGEDLGDVYANDMLT